VREAYDVIRGLIAQPERIAEMEARIAAEYRPARWEDTAAAILQALVPGGEAAEVLRDVKIAAD
jgi:hypothetical protein